MLKKMCAAIFLLLISISNFVSAVIGYDIHDIGTLQTYSSEAIALNNKGQILGWYNIDGSQNGKHFFVRDRDGTFHEIVMDFSSESFQEIPKGLRDIQNYDWKYLTEDGRAYGILNWPEQNPILFMWDQKNGVINLGRLPGAEISAINNAGQVLIKSVVDIENGKSIRRPVIWENGKITKFKGLESNSGIPSDISYGLDINNNGEVVGCSIVYTVYKNKMYTQTRATKWINGEVFDLHDSLPKTEKTIALAINDRGDILFNVNNTPFLSNVDGGYVVSGGWMEKINNDGSCYNDYIIFAETKQTITSTGILTHQVQTDRDSLWTIVKKIIDVNDNGEIIAQGHTIYGEQHAILLTPVKSN